MTEFTQEELIVYAKENLTRSIQEQMGKFIGERWNKYVEGQYHCGEPRNLIYDALDEVEWLESKIRINTEMKDLRLLVLFTVDLSVAGSNPSEVEVSAYVKPSIAVGVDGKLTAAQAEFRPCGQSLYGNAFVDLTVKP